jgi:hypothetical protein
MTEISDLTNLKGFTFVLMETLDVSRFLYTWKRGITSLI